MQSFASRIPDLSLQETIVNVARGRVMTLSPFNMHVMCKKQRTTQEQAVWQGRDATNGSVRFTQESMRQLAPDASRETLIQARPLPPTRGVGSGSLGVGAA